MFVVNGKTYYLKRCTADSQLWFLKEKTEKDTRVLHGILVVYVDDFLLQTLPGELRNCLLAALGNVWKLDKEITLSATRH